MVDNAQQPSSPAAQQHEHGGQQEPAGCHRQDEGLPRCSPTTTTSTESGPGRPSRRQWRRKRWHPAQMRTPNTTSTTWPLYVQCAKLEITRSSARSWARSDQIHFVITRPPWLIHFFLINNILSRDLFLSTRGNPPPKKN